MRLIAAGIRTGATLDDAAAVAGVSSRSIFRWVKDGGAASEYRDREASGVRIDPGQRRTLSAYDLACADLFDTVREARADFAIRHADVVVTAATQPRQQVTTITREIPGPDGKLITTTERRVEMLPPDERAAQWLLSRRLPQTWGRTQRIEVSGPDGGEIPIPTDELREQVLTKLAALAGPTPRLPPGTDLGDVIDAEVVTEDLADTRDLTGVPDIDSSGEPPRNAQDRSNPPVGTDTASDTDYGSERLSRIDGPDAPDPRPFEHRIPDRIGSNSRSISLNVLAPDPQGDW
ncbi:MAG: hypothetical protein JO337_04745 [Acidimicrobiales bacterium]|nr:hypothetical protein [Acidimicrobiales bacterium]